MPGRSPTAKAHHARDAPNLRGAIAVLTWGGLRGVISVALALALPQVPERAPILAVCYAVVVFSIIVQGLTMQQLALRFYGAKQRTMLRRARTESREGQHGILATVDELCQVREGVMFGKYPVAI
jgi:NhaP-type Na+/H+ or K+/H+ antiporter